MRRLFFVSVVLGFAASCNCGSNAQVSCSNNAQCPVNQVCQAGLCTAVSNNTDGGNNNGNRDSGTNNNGSDSGTNNNGGDGGCTGLACQQVNCPGGGTTSISGKVYDPSGQVPLYNVIVYVPNGQVQAFPTGVSCDTCGALVSGNPLVITLTGPDGAFTLTNVPVGPNIPLVMQIGRWRRQVTISQVNQCVNNPITDINVSRMPKSKAEGDIPRMAISTGNADPFECVLWKMGLSGEMTDPGGGGRIDYYYEPSNGGGATLDGNTPNGTSLYDTLTTLKNYDIVLLPCEGWEDTNKTTQEQQNIIDYTSAGGRLFTTHFGYVWTRGSSTSAVPQPFPSTASWVGNGSDPSTQSGLEVVVNQSFPKGKAFYQWLGNVSALDTSGYFPIDAARYNVGLVNGDGGTTAWLFGDHTGSNSPPGAGGTYNWTPHLTFNTPYNPPPLPDGDAGVQCGRVVYSDFHVNTSNSGSFPGECGSSTAFTPQEKALVFMLFDVSSCIQSDTTAPSVCGGINTSCTSSSQCCSGLSCITNTGANCTGGGELCTCNSVIQ